MADPQISWLAAEAALCLWEEVNASKDGPWLYWRAQNGTCATRQAIMNVAQACSDDWHALQPDGDPGLAGLDVFDWEFCPVWIRAALDWKVPAGQYPVLRPEAERHAAIRAAAPSQQPA